MLRHVILAWPCSGMQYLLGHALYSLGHALACNTCLAMLRHVILAWPCSILAWPCSGMQYSLGHALACNTCLAMLYTRLAMLWHVILAWPMLRHVIPTWPCSGMQHSLCGIQLLFYMYKLCVTYNCYQYTVLTTPLSQPPTGYSGIDYDAAVYILSKIVKKFVAVIQEEANCISDDEGNTITIH